MPLYIYLNESTNEYREIIKGINLDLDDTIVSTFTAKCIDYFGEREIKGKFSSKTLDFKSTNKSDSNEKTYSLQKISKSFYKGIVWG